MAVNEENLSKHCQDTYGRDLIFAGECGSIIHNLYRPNSDDDYYIVLAPNFHDLYTHETFHEKKLTPQADYFFFNGVEFRDHLEKLNPNFLDTLYSSNIIYIHPELRWMISNREDIVRSNLQALYQSYQELAVYLHGKFLLPGQDSDTRNKCMMHIMRIDHVLTEYHRLGFDSYGDAIFCDDETRKKLLRLRNGLSAIDGNKLSDAEKSYIFYHHFRNITLMEKLYRAHNPTDIERFAHTLEESMRKIYLSQIQTSSH